MYYDVPEGLGLRKIATDRVPAFIQKHGRGLLRGLAGGALTGYGVQQPAKSNSGGSVKNAPVIQQRPGIPAPADDPAPVNQRPTGYGATPKSAPSTWAQKIKDSRNGLAGPANAPTEFRRHMYQQGQRFLNSPLAQGYIDRLRNGSK